MSWRESDIFKYLKLLQVGKVSAVINFSPAPTADQHACRAERTRRDGIAGAVLTLIQPDEFGYVWPSCRAYGIELN